MSLLRPHVKPSRNVRFDIIFPPDPQPEIDEERMPCTWRFPGPVGDPPFYAVAQPDVQHASYYRSPFLFPFPASTEHTFLNEIHAAMSGRLYALEGTRAEGGFAGIF